MSISRDHIKDPQDVTLVVYRDPASCSTLNSRLLEVVVLSRASDTPLVFSEDTPEAMLVCGVGFLPTTSSTFGCRVPLPEDLNSHSEDSTLQSGCLKYQLVFKGEISVGDRSWYQPSSYNKYYHYYPYEEEQDKYQYYYEYEQNGAERSRTRPVRTRR